MNAAREANNRLVDRAYTEKWLVSAKSSPEEDAAFAMRLKASRAHITRYADGRTESQWSPASAFRKSPVVRARPPSAVLRRIRSKHLVLISFSVHIFSER